jgi:hypothetical protein
MAEGEVDVNEALWLKSIGWLKNTEINACLMLNISFFIKKIKFVRAISGNMCIFANLKT